MSLDETPVDGGGNFDIDVDDNDVNVHDGHIIDEGAIDFDMNDGGDDDVDDLDNLFSFATAEEDTPTSASQSKTHEEGDSKDAKNPDDTNKISDMNDNLATTPTTSSAAGMSAPHLIDVGDDDDDDLDLNSTTSQDSLLELLEQQKEPLTILEPTTATKKIRSNGSSDFKDSEETSEEKDALEETNLQELLDWLDEDDDAAAIQIIEEDDEIQPPTVMTTFDETPEESSSLPSLPSEPQFDTLEEALQSSKASLTQIRNLFAKEGFSISASMRPHLWCRVICGKTLSDVMSSSVADSFQTWESQNQYLWKSQNSQDRPSVNHEAKMDGIISSKDHSEDTLTNSIEDDGHENADTSLGVSHTKDAEMTANEQKKEQNVSEEKTSDTISHTIPPSDDNNTTPTLTKRQIAQRDWILDQADQLADRMVVVLKGEKAHCQQALASILLNHYFTGQKTAADDEDDDPDDGKDNDNKGTEATTESDDGPTPSKKTMKRIPDYQDSLLPPVACAILCAGVPKTAAAVMLSHIVPHFMPLLALTRAEREQAAHSLHRQFYLLAAYHVPSLVLHLDRHLPNWFLWPDFEGHGPKQGQGYIPMSYLLSHLAGELPDIELNPRWLLALWDLMLTSSNNSLRFFMVLAVLEDRAHEIVLCTDDALKHALEKVLRFEQEDTTGEFAIQDANDCSSSNQEAVQWVQKWTDKAQLLWERTPFSIVRRLKRIEDTTVTEALTKRQKDIEERMQQKLEAQAKAHELAVEAERERKADEARLRLTRARLVAFYRQYNPGKESNIDTIMKTYTGRYEVLDSKLKKKYGVGFNPAKKPNPGTTRKQSTKVDASAHRSKDDIAKSKVADDRKRNQIVAKVSSSEVLTEICWSKAANKVRLDKLERGNKLEEKLDTRLPLKFYLVDTRPMKTAQEQGRFPTSVSFPPEDLTDPDRLQQQEDMFEALRGSVHVVIMGEGFAALPALYGHKMTEALSDCIIDDDARNNNCALFFLKIGFPFVSILDGGFAGAHSFLFREGKKYHLRVNDVLADYDPEISIFGQFEIVHNSTGREKAQRALQGIFDSSLVALTKNARRLETAANELSQSDPQAKKGGGNVVARFLGGKVGKDKKEGGGSKIENGNKTAGQPVFRNPFARKNGPTKKLSRDSSSKSLDVESVDDLELDTSESNDKINNSKRITTETISTTQERSEVQTKPTERRQEPQKNNPFAGFGAAFKNATNKGNDNNASGNKIRGMNPFARFNQSGKNLDRSQHGIGSSQHGMDKSQHELSNSKHGFAGLNKFRKNTFARMRSSGEMPTSDGSSSAVVVNGADDEVVAFNQSAKAGNAIMSESETESAIANDDKIA